MAITSAAGTIANKRVTMRRNQTGNRKSRNPSITICPANVPVTVFVDSADPAQAGPFTLDTALEPSTENEPNNTPATATPNSPQGIVGTIYPAGDVDFIKSNVNETIKRYPGLGEVPVMGALFRSTEFQNEQTELMFVITPRLVRPLAESPRVPTDNHVVPSRAEVYLNGALESSTPAPAAPASETP